MAQKKDTTVTFHKMIPGFISVLGKMRCVEKIEVKWPSGKMQILENIKANQILEVKNPNDLFMINLTRIRITILLLGRSDLSCYLACMRKKQVKNS